MSDKKHLAHAALGAISILAIGIVTGVWLDRTILHPQAVLAHSTQAATALDEPHEEFLEDMRVDLGFTDEQARQVHEIMSRHQAAVNETWVAVHERLDAAIDSVTAEIEAILDSSQRSALHQWLIERHGLGEGH